MFLGRALQSLFIEDKWNDKNEHLRLKKKTEFYMYNAYVNFVIVYYIIVVY